MKKKSPAKVKRSDSNGKKTKAVKSEPGRIVEMVVRPQATPSVKEDPRFAQAVENYEAALRAIQERKFERAKGLLQKVIDGPSTELADRAAIHLKLCQQHAVRTITAFKTTEEHYDFAVSLMNQGKYDEARSHLEKILKQNPKADYGLYGLAVLDCLTNKVEDSLRHLDEAIRLNPALRFQARNDSDFQNLADDPRFTELLYPEPGTEFTPPLPR
jgi:tetratricopeptide (TPR) repeat protein